MKKISSLLMLAVFALPVAAYAGYGHLLHSPTDVYCDSPEGKQTLRCQQEQKEHEAAKAKEAEKPAATEDMPPEKPYFSTAPHIANGIRQ